MAEATITLFREFEPEKTLRFADKVMQLVGVEVYGLEYGEVTTENVTLIVQTAGPGSKTSASAGAEVKIDLDDDEWPHDELGKMKDVSDAKEKIMRIKTTIGQALLGGVEEEGEAIVNVWPRLFAVTGWYGIGYQQWPDKA